MERKHTPVYGIKGKLISAVCMLLVAMIMVVSSTYAWFTLSTAPEVTGISTAIGANGALEIKLDGTVDGTNINNIAWGNLVDLGDEQYGLQKIVLYPSALSTYSTAEGTYLNSNFLAYPTYGADGRPSSTLSTNVTKGAFDNTLKVFKENSSNLGVSALGSASGVTARQQAWRDAKNAASKASTLAKNAAAVSLAQNGSVLANAVVAKALESANNTATFGTDDVAALRSIINAFGYNYTPAGSDVARVHKGLLDDIADAYLQQFKGYVASKAGNEEAFNYVIANITSLSQIVTVTVDNGTVTVTPTTLTIQGVDGGYAISESSRLFEGIADYYQLKTNIEKADAALATIEAGSTDTVTWDQFNRVLPYLVNSSGMTVNGKTVDELKTTTGQNALAQEVASGKGIKVVMPAGSGVYAQLAEHVGNYTAPIKINVNLNGTELNGIDATMATNSTASKSFLAAASDEVIALEEPEGNTSGEARTLTEFYGYILDFVFRTNAASSNLLLQVPAVDRIYDDNNNEETRGGGSNMTFKSNSVDFDNDKVIALMSHIRVVFFQAETTNNGSVNKVLVYAKLDLTEGQYTIGADGVTANMYLYELVDAKSYQDGTETKYCYVKTDDLGTPSYYSDYECNNPLTLTDDQIASLKDAKVERKLTGDDAIITALPQNGEVKVSLLVYLDGEGMDNASVSATGTSSVTGSMNIQFSSSAELTPMEYGDLHTPAQTTPANGTQQNP